MATTVILRHKDGRRIPIGTALARGQASKMKADVERWLAAHQSLTVTTANGLSAEVTPRSVVAIELVHEQDRLDGDRPGEPQ